jgi:hypothetical protein
MPKNRNIEYYQNDILTHYSDFLTKKLVRYLTKNSKAGLVLKTVGLPVWVKQFSIVSAAYVVAELLTHALLPFTEVQIGTDATFAASLLFFPHGVRVLTAWLLGWRSLPFLLPVTYATNYVNLGADGFQIEHILAASFGVTCAIFSFSFLGKIGLDFRLGGVGGGNWKNIALVGSFASVLNSAGKTFFYESPPCIAAAFLLGDIAGMLAIMLLLMLAFRWYRLRSHER